MKGMIRDEHTVIVLNGRPYGLYREKYPAHNNVCFLCELQHICLRKEGPPELRELCRGSDDSDAWFFLEDYQHLELLILDFVDQADEKYLNSK